MFTRLISFQLAKVKASEVMESSYQQLVDLIAKRYVLQLPFRVIHSLSIQILPHYIKYNIIIKSFSLEIGSSTWEQALILDGLTSLYPCPKTINLLIKWFLMTKS